MSVRAKISNWYTERFVRRESIIEACKTNEAQTQDVLNSNFQILETNKTSPSTMVIIVIAAVLVVAGIGTYKGGPLVVAALKRNAEDRKVKGEIKQQEKAQREQIQQLAMQLAEQKLARAHKNMGEQDYKRARVLAEEAELDARLAESRVLTAKSQEQLADLQARITRLRKQLGDLQ